MRANDFAPLQRQETSILATERPILAQLGQNSVHSVSEARAEVKRAIHDMLGRWANGCPVRDARMHLARLLAMLEVVED
jgi:hypothetical protein